MTIVCALFDQDRQRLVLGCNSRALVGDTVLPADRSKWLMVGDWAVAFTGRGLMNDVLENRRADWPEGETSALAMAQLFFRWFRDADIGKEDEGAMDFDTSGMLVHRDGRVFDIDCRLSVEKINANEMWAVGSGMEYALGAAHVLKPYSLSAADLVSKAVAAAIALDSGCPGSPVIEEF